MSLNLNKTYPYVIPLPIKTTDVYKTQKWLFEQLVSADSWYSSEKYYGSEVRQNSIDFYFCNKKDAIMFGLRWS
jgi:hypothetical protein